MPSTLDPRRTDGALPAIISVRTAGPLVVAALLGAVLVGAGTGAGGARAAGVALLAWSTVLLAQLCGPLLREASKQAAGRWRAVLFNLPFALFFLPALVWALVTRPAFDGPVAGAGLGGAGLGGAAAGSAARLAVGLVAGVLFGLAMQATAWKQWRLGFDRDLLELLPPVSPALLITQGWMLAGSAVFQELFYRGALVTILSGWSPPVIVAAGTLAFVLEHTSNRWSTRANTGRYYLRLTILSVGLGFLAVEVSLAAALAAHLAFNAVPAANLLMRWRSRPARSRPAPQPSPAASV
jgi:hypothetical protein